MSSSIKLQELYPIFDPGRLMWVQKDMLHFLVKISQSAARFLKRLDSLEPGLWQKFAQRYINREETVPRRDRCITGNKI